MAQPQLVPQLPPPVPKIEHLSGTCTYTNNQMQMTQGKILDLDCVKNITKLVETWNNLTISDLVTLVNSSFDSANIDYILRARLLRRYDTITQEEKDKAWQAGGFNNSAGYVNKVTEEIYQEFAGIDRSEAQTEYSKSIYKSKQESV